MTVLTVSHYFYFVFAVQVIAGVLLLTGRFVPLALALLAPMLVNIVLYHSLMDPAGLAGRSLRYRALGGGCLPLSGFLSQHLRGTPPPRRRRVHELSRPRLHALCADAERTQTQRTSDRKEEKDADLYLLSKTSPRGDYSVSRNLNYILCRELAIRTRRRSGERARTCRKRSYPSSICLGSLEPTPRRSSTPRR